MVPEVGEQFFVETQLLFQPVTILGFDGGSLVICCVPLVSHLDQDKGGPCQDPCRPGAEKLHRSNCHSRSPHLAVGDTRRGHVQMCDVDTTGPVPVQGQPGVWLGESDGGARSTWSVPVAL